MAYFSATSKLIEIPFPVPKNFLDDVGGLLNQVGIESAASCAVALIEAIRKVMKSNFFMDKLFVNQIYLNTTIIKPK
jgi:hypothetical protein